MNGRFRNGLFTEDEGSRVKGRRITLSDINGNSLKWKPFNGSWINGMQQILQIYVQEPEKNGHAINFPLSTL